MCACVRGQVCASLGLPIGTKYDVHCYWTLPGGGQLPHIDHSKYTCRLVLPSCLSQFSLHQLSEQEPLAFDGSTWLHRGFCMSAKLGKGGLNADGTDSTSTRFTSTRSTSTRFTRRVSHP